MSFPAKTLSSAVADFTDYVEPNTSPRSRLMKRQSKQDFFFSMLRVDHALSKPVESVTAAAFKPGDYVLATKYSDADPHDPWRVDFVCEVHVGPHDCTVSFVDSGVRRFRHAQHLTREEGDAILAQFKAYK